MSRASADAGGAGEHEAKDVTGPGSASSSCSAVTSADSLHPADCDSCRSPFSPFPLFLPLFPSPLPSPSHSPLRSDVQIPELPLFLCSDCSRLSCLSSSLCSLSPSSSPCCRLSSSLIPSFARACLRVHLSLCAASDDAIRARYVCQSRMESGSGRRHDAMIRDHAVSVVQIRGRRRQSNEREKEETGIKSYNCDSYPERMESDFHVLSLIRSFLSSYLTRALCSNDRLTACACPCMCVTCQPCTRSRPSFPFFLCLAPSFSLLLMLRSVHLNTFLSRSPLSVSVTAAACL